MSNNKVDEAPLPNKTSNTPKLSKYQLFVVVLLALLQFTIVIDFSIMAPLGDLMMKKLSINTAQFGLLMSCYAFSAGIAGILAAALADRYDRKKFLILVYAGFVLGTFLCGMATSYETLLIARSITGVFAGVVGAISMTIVTDLFGLNQRGRVLGYIQMSFAGSQVMGIPLGILLAYRMGWNDTFIVIALLSFLVLALIILKLKPITEHLALQTGENAVKSLLKVLTHRSYLVGFILITMIAMGGAMLMPFGTAFLINNVHITQGQLPLLFMLTGIATIFIMPIVGKLSDRMPKIKLFTLGSILAIIMTTVFTNLSVLPFWLVVTINIIMFAAIMSRMIPAMALMTAIPEKKDRGAYMNLSASLKQFSGGLAALFAGYIVYQPSPSSPLQHFDTLGYVVSIFSIICIFLLYKIHKMLKQRGDEQ